MLENSEDTENKATYRFKTNPEPTVESIKYAISLWTKDHVVKQNVYLLITFVGTSQQPTCCLIFSKSLSISGQIKYWHEHINSQEMLCLRRISHPDISIDKKPGQLFSSYVIPPATRRH